MSDLFTMLRSATRALDAQRFGLDVTGQNIANVNTPGYVRRSAILSEVPPADPWSPGGGVDATAVEAARAPFIEARLRLQQPATARQAAIADQLSIVVAALGQPGASLDATLARFYNTYSALAENPISQTARQQVILEGQALARTFAEIADRIAGARTAADREIRDTVQQVNALAQQLATINGDLAGAGANAKEGLVDQQALLISALGTLVDVGIIQHADGSVDVSIGNGRALVVGATTYALSPVSAPPDGFAGIVSDGAAVPTDVTSEITGGRIAGLLQVRDAILPGYANQLDQLAFSVATDVNDLARSGFDLAGNAGVDFFDQPAAVAGAARSMAVSAVVAGDGGLVVAAGAPAAGNNDVARAIAGLQDSAMSGSSARPVEAWANLVYQVSTDAKMSADARDAHEQVTAQLENLRDQISGVSIDEEAAMLLRFQRAYEANARFFQAADRALDLLMQLVGA